MIASLRGTVAVVGLDGVVLDVGGVGYLARCTPRALAAMRRGEEVALATSLVVREDSMTIYGFTESEERDMFELLQTASGVGPKVAQAMLAVHGPEALRSAIAKADLNALVAVPGIGRKGAEKIVVELRDRVGPAVQSTASRGAAWRVQVHDALLGLGWSSRDADRAVEAVAAGLETDAEPNVSEVLRDALRSLAVRT